MRYLARTHKPSRGFEGRLIWGTTTTNGLREIKTGTSYAATVSMSAYLRRLRTTPISTGRNLAPPHSEVSCCGRNSEKSVREVVGACRRSDYLISLQSLGRTSESFQESTPIAFGVVDSTHLIATLAIAIKVAVLQFDPCTIATLS